MNNKIRMLSKLNELSKMSVKFKICTKNLFNSKQYKYPWFSYKQKNFENGSVLGHQFHKFHPVALSIDASHSSAEYWLGETFPGF